MEPFHYKGARLFCEEIPIEDIAARVGTPLYIYSASAFKDRFNAYEDALANKEHLICYAVKSNSNLAILALLARLGAGADIVSGGQLFRALRAGIPADKIVYSGVGKGEKEIREAIKAGILMFNVESLEELDNLDQIAASLRKRARIALRVNPDVDPKTHPYISTGLKSNKFGIPHSQAVEAYRKAADKEWLEVVGIDCHIGSQLTDTTPFVDAIRRIKELIQELEEAGIRLRYVDIGGGLGIRYSDETPPSPAQYAREVLSELQDMPQTIIVEPGRSISGNSGILVTSLLYTKENEEKRFYIVDAAMNDLARPSLYKAYHEILPVTRSSDVNITKVDVVGPICETGDFLARDRELPEMNRGDLLAVMSAGAYGFTMSSNYNSRPRVAEVLVDGDRYSIVRKRETYSRLIEGEYIPEWLTE